MLGLKHNVNYLVDYDPEWPVAFAIERERIAQSVGGSAKGIEHYGSTAVPGLRAKPIIDILVGVTPFEDWQRCRAPLETLGYDYAANAGVPGHHIFGRGRDMTERTHLAHVVAFMGHEWRSNFALRDALRLDATLRNAYAGAKEQASEGAPEGERNTMRSSDQSCTRHGESGVFVNLACANRETTTRAEFLQSRYRECISCGCLNSRLKSN